MFLAFVGVSLACTRVLSDQFITAKWYALHWTALATAALLVLGGRVPPVPEFVRRRRLLLALGGGLGIMNTFRGGLLWAQAPLLDRLSVVVLAVALAAFLRRRGGDLTSLLATVATTVAATVACGFAELLGLRPLGALTAGDSRSAFFGNASIAGQFLSLALPFLLWLGSGAGRARALLIEALAAMVVAYLALIGSRSGLLAIGAALAVWVLLRPPRRGIPLLRVVALAGLLAVVTAALSGLSLRGLAASLTGQPGTEKAISTSIRLQLWGGTLQMIADQPWGVGSGNFPDRFVPYAVGRLPPDEGVLHRWPHDEWLRVAAEEGLPFTLLAAGALLPLAAAVRARGRGRPAGRDFALLASLTTAFVVQATFQFPLAVAPTALIATLGLVLALEMVEDGEPDGSGSRSRAELAPLSPPARAVCALLLLGAAVAETRVVAADVLAARRPRTREALATACRLDPRRLDACVLAAWREVRAGDREAARATLAGVLRRSPYYFPAIKLAGQEALDRGALVEGCLDLWLYDRLFSGASSVRPTLTGQCPSGLVESFGTRIDVPRYGVFPGPAR